MSRDAMLIVALIIGLVFFVFLVILFTTLRLWIQAQLTGTQVSLADIIRRKLRRLPATLIVHTAIALSQRKIDVPVAEIEATYLAFGSEAASATELAALVLEKRG